MLKPILRKTGHLFLALSGSLLMQGPASAVDAGAFNAQWSALEDRGEGSSLEQLLQRTQLLNSLDTPEAWLAEGTWDKARAVLTAWESSPEIKLAGPAYVGLLDTIGWAVLPTGLDLPQEEIYRAYLQKALKVTSSSNEEGRLLFHLGASLLRSQPDSLENRRRVEAYLQQSVLALGAEPVSMEVHFLLGQIYSSWGSEGRTDSGEESWFARAVFHYRYVLGLGSGRPEVIERARAALDELLQPGLKLDVRTRFLPQSDLRVRISSRNLGEVRVELVPLPHTMEGNPLSLDQLARIQTGEPEQSPFQAGVGEFPVGLPDSIDWIESEVRLGEMFTSGWYRLRVEGGGLSRDALLLVTSLEVTVVPRENGNLTLWAVDAESGSPMQGGSYHLLDPAGEVVLSGFCDPSGMTNIVTGGDLSWAELHVGDGFNLAVIRRQDMAQPRDPNPWVIPETIQVYPGGVLRWSLIGVPGSGTAGESGTLVRLPDGENLTAEIVNSAQGRLRCEVNIPETTTVYGPVHLLLPDGTAVRLSWLVRPDPLPLVVEFSGEKFHPGRDVFVSLAPVGVRIMNSMTGEGGEPGFIRVVVRRQEDSIVTDSPRERAGSGEVVFENILNLKSRGEGDLFFELPDLGGDEESLALKMEVYWLESGQLAGEASFGLVPYRALLEWRLSEKIVADGDSQLAVNLMDLQKSASLTRSMDGEIVVSRETWENRYIHRKRGTPLSETEYDDLPDRSLLGSAKTDYELLERGLVREEVLRIPVDPDAEPSVPLSVKRQGHYRVVYESREPDVRASYPDGLMEFWVLPENGDFGAFRSDKPRLVMEQARDGSHEILVILDRTQSSVLVDIEDMDGGFRTSVIEPGSQALFIRHPAEEIPLAACRAIVSGERRTDFLCQRVIGQHLVTWEIGQDLGMGLNPGSSFELEATLGQGTVESGPVWVFYPESDAGPALVWLKEQHRRQGVTRGRCSLEAVSLNDWLPLFDPLGDQQQAPETRIFTEPANQLDPLTLLSLLPPGRVGGSARGITAPITCVLDSTDQRALLSGSYPPVAGRWQLVAYSETTAGWLASQTWPVSTELPLRSSLKGPPVFRRNDQALVRLTIENTTRRPQAVKFNARTDGVFHLVGAPAGSELLAPGSFKRFPLQLEAAGAGNGNLSTGVVGGATRSEAFYKADVLVSKPEVVMQAWLLPEGTTDTSADLSPEGWQSARIYIGSGMGGHLSALWPHLRTGYLEREPLLTALTDWALERVRQHHGLSEELSVEKDDRLGQVLEKYQSGGGLAWTTGGNPDSWLTGLVVWTLETFTSLGDGSYPVFRETASAFLERVMITESEPAGTRILALRTLSARAHRDPRIRPTRIQAKSFLDFLHNRDLLKVSDVAMLLDVARAYHFSEEVRLLTDYLEGRLDTEASRSDSGLWGLSLVHLSVEESTQTSGLRMAVMDRLVQQLAGSVSRPSWEQVASFLNLLAEFLWEGDFSVDGGAVVAIGDREETVIDLAPHGDSRGHYQTDLHPGELSRQSIPLKINTSNSTSPVLVTLIGERFPASPLPAFPDQAETLFRRFSEPTLLQGVHVLTTPLGGGEPLMVGDVMELRLDLVVDEDQPYAEFSFAIPAGTTLPRSGIEHKMTSVAPSGPQKRTLSQLDRGNPLRRIIRVEPLRRGEHQIILSYEVNWEGRYTFPAHDLVFPEKGKAYTLGSARTLQVESGQDLL
jgi:hypothetical protein